MPAVLTHKTIMLMARERLKAMASALEDKRKAGVKPMTDLEHRLLFLAGQAADMMTDGELEKRGVQFPDGGGYGTPFGKGTSPWSVMGSMGPDITAFSNMLGRGQSWVFDLLHKGNPDDDREPVVAGTTDFALTFWSQVTSKTTDKEALRKMRAYVLGHLCHLAGDIVSHPFINDVEWHLGQRSRPKLSHAGGEGSIDARVAQKLLLRESTREGQAWDQWWPTSDEVPGVFYDAYTEALDALYKAKSAGRPKGFGDFEKRFIDLQAPELSVDFVKNGYHFYRSGIVSMGYGYGYGSWFGFLVPLVIPLSFTIALSGALPHSREFFTKRWHEVGERGWFELLTLPLAVGSVIPLFYGIWIASLTTRGVAGLTGAGIAFSVVSLILAIVFFATVGTDVPAWARWLLILAPLAIIPLVFGSIGAADLLRDDREDTKKRGALALIYGVPFVIWVCFLVMFLITTMGLGSLVGELVGLASDTAGDVFSVVFYVLGMLCLTGALIYVWIVVPKILRDIKIPEYAKPFPADRPHFVRLFDDTTLGHDPKLADPKARDLYYPSADRSLLKLWWEGPGDLWIRSEQRWLSFSTTGTGAPTQQVPAPVMPMTAKDYATFLTGKVTGLKAAPFFPGDKDLETFLPTGSTFDDEGVEKKEKQGNVDALADYKKLKKTEAEADYVLRHADKPFQAVRVGQRGTVETGFPQEEYVKGPGKVSSAGTKVTGTGTLFNLFFEAGDQIAVGPRVRSVTKVVSDTELEISSAFTPDASAADYLQLSPNDEFVPGPGKVTVKKSKVTGTDTKFKSFFILADLIVVAGQAREVTEVVSDTELEVGHDFKPSPAADSDYQRLGGSRERTEGYPYVSTPAVATALGGGAVMDYAADLAVLLCLGMTPHLLPTTAKVPTLKNRTAEGGGAVSDSVGKVYQVFRNWSLDRRRLNEWRMIVSGGAHTEKTAPDDYDAALVQPKPGDWSAANVVKDGEQVANAQGWVPALREWMKRVTSGSGNALDSVAPSAGEPTTQQLSQALAFILDLSAPVKLRP
ncbi:MAG TPA: hypothetical protein VND93_23265 [Myxococcales bacterium]|nr:hypothetical protein [Myxococcales bacterium]